MAMVVKDRAQRVELLGGKFVVAVDVISGLITWGLAAAVLAIAGHLVPGPHLAYSAALAVVVTASKLARDIPAIRAHAARPADTMQGNEPGAGTDPVEQQADAPSGVGDPAAPATPSNRAARRAAAHANRKPGGPRRPAPTRSR